MSQIDHIHAREILDSRGNPTVEADVTLANGIAGRAANVRVSSSARTLISIRVPQHHPELVLRSCADIAGVHLKLLVFRHAGVGTHGLGLVADVFDIGQRARLG